MKRSLLDRFRRNPYPLYSLLRRATPVFRIPGRDIWLLLDYESVKRALNDSATFSSRAAPPSGKPLNWLIFLDPPEHTKLRGIISRTITPRAIAELEPMIRRLARELLDSAAVTGTVDLVADFSAPLPLLVIAEMLGIPVVDRARFLQWADAILRLGDSIAGGDAATRAYASYHAARDDMRLYLENLLRTRTHGARGLLAQLAAAEVDGERLAFDDILGFFQLLLLAGTETTTNLIGNAVLCFDTNRDQLTAVVEEPDLLPRAIEEVLRYRSPVQLVFRMTTRDVRIGGKRIPANALVLPVVGAANRDPAEFASPRAFDITRSDNHHAGFGHGIHYCLGAALARLEARVALEELLPRLRDFRIEGWEPSTGINVHGPRSLTLKLGELPRPLRS